MPVKLPKVHMAHSRSLVNAGYDPYSRGHGRWRRRLTYVWCSASPTFFPYQECSLQVQSIKVLRLQAKKELNLEDRSQS